MHKFKAEYFVLIFFFCVSSISESGAQKDSLSVYPEWKYYDGVSNALYKRLCKNAFSHLEVRTKRVKDLAQPSDYKVYREEVRAKLMEIIGPFPERTPLRPVVTGVIKQDHYRIEKLYFQSLPQYFVTAALYIPERRIGKLPAILFCSGHSAEGFRGQLYQHTILNLVKKGFAVFAFDPIGQGERIQYPDDNGNSTLGPTKEHSYPGTQVFLSGRSPAQYFVWDGIRALDYLATRNDIIDMDRMGIAGRSGGGTQSTFIAAMDDRIKASVTESYITSYDKLLRSVGPTDAEQTLLYALHDRMDFPDFLIARAPNPVMIISTTGDFFSIQGARDTYHETKRFYDVFGKPGNISLAEDDGPHASTEKNREAMYAFFQNHLNNPGSNRDEPVETMDTKLLEVTKEGSVFRSLAGSSLFDINSRSFKELRKAHSKTELTEEESFMTKIAKDVVSSTGYVPPGVFESAIFCGRFRRANYFVEKYLVNNGGNYFMPVLWFRPLDSNGQILLLIDEDGKKKAAAPTGLADRLANKGYQVVLPDLTGVGELGGGFNRGSAFINGVPLNVWYLSVLTKESIASIRMADIKRLREFIDAQLAGDGRVSVIAKGALCTDLLYLSAIDDVFEQVVLIEPLISIRSLIEEKNYAPQYVMSAVPGAALRFDIPDLIYLTSRKAKVLSINPVNAKGDVVSSEVYRELTRQYQNTPSTDVNTIIKDDYIADLEAFLTGH